MIQSAAEAILQNAAGAIGTGGAQPIAGLKTVAFTVSGVFVATVTFEATTVEDPQPGDWYPVNAYQSGTAIIGTTAAAPGIYRASIAGLTWVRARVSSWTSGTVTVLGKAVAVDDTSKVANVNVMGSYLTSAQRLPAYLVNGAGIEAYIGGASDAFTAIGMSTVAFNYGFNGANYDRIRVANVFKSVNATVLAANTGVIWTPAAGKKFRLMGFRLYVDVAITAQLLDNAATLDFLYGPGASVLTADYGQGRLSLAANNGLTISNTGAATVNVRGSVWGTEE